MSTMLWADYLLTTAQNHLEVVEMSLWQSISESRPEFVNSLEK